MQVNNKSTPIEINAIDPQHWVANHSDYLYSYVSTRINDDEQAKDLVQETFLAALEKVFRFEGRSSERTWLTAILKNKVVDVYRRKSPRPGERSDAPISAAHHEDFLTPKTDTGKWNINHKHLV